VLFVDDEARALDALRRSARLHGLEARFVASAATALELLANWPADAVVADLNMPGGDGLALLGEVRRQRPAAARFILSGCVDRRQTLAGLQLAHQSFPKPCNVGDIAGRLTRCIRLREQLGAPGLAALAGRETGLPLDASTCPAFAGALDAGHASTQMLADVACGTPALAATLLRLANSTALSPEGSVTALPAAIARLGVGALQDWLSLAAPAGCGVSGLVARRFQLEQARSRHIAWAAKRIAAFLGLRRAALEASYLGGLLHNMGRLLLLARAPAAYLDVLDECAVRGAPLAAAERMVFGADYTTFGGYLAALWGLPSAIGDAVTGHLAPGASAAGGRGAATAPVHLAVCLAGGGPDGAPPPDAALLEAFGLTGRLGALRAAVEIPEDPAAAAC
jgi:HD-like signal output (HDOD) protein